MPLTFFRFQLSEMAVVVGSGRNVPQVTNTTDWNRPTFQCHPSDDTAAAILLTLGVMGIGANVALMAVILLKRPLRRSVF